MKNFWEHILKKVFSRNYLLPFFAMILLFVASFCIESIEIFQRLMIGLCILATGYNGFGSLSTFIKGKNGK